MKEIFFYIGTEAELIKMFPVILACQRKKKKIYIIASGQNDIASSRIMNIYNLHVDLELSKEEDIKKNAVGLFSWYVKTYYSAVKKIKKCFLNSDFKNSYMVVHGDTVSTVMGAWIGKSLGMHVCHVEAGLRSHNMFNPFPEEIDRLLTSRCARVHFAPGQEQCNNLKNAKGCVINTKYNTILDSLLASQSIPYASQELTSTIEQQKYFVFVLHRQENLANKKFVEEVVKEIIQISDEVPCMMILHAPTKVTLREMGLLETLQKLKNVKLLPRMDYFDFMKLLNCSEFVITDGGSNQEELYYMGKPCLIMRKTTERSEGLGENAKLFGGQVSAIQKFATEYTVYRRNAVTAQISPSDIISEYLCK